MRPARSSLIPNLVSIWQLGLSWSLLLWKIVWLKKNGSSAVQQKVNRYHCILNKGNYFVAFHWYFPFFASYLTQLVYEMFYTFYSKLESLTRGRTDEFSNTLATEKLRIGYYLITVLNSGLLLYTSCLRLSLHHGGPWLQLLGSCFLLWPWTLICDLDLWTWPR